VRAHLGAALGASYLLLGCASAAFAHAQLTTTVQFDREVVHILDNHCVMCHADGGLAFPLLTYEQTYAARWQIRQDALNRHMAPWAAVPGYGELANDNGLTQREIDFLSSWAESYGPRNNGQVYTRIALGSAAPPVVQAHFDFSRWVLGTPDLRLPVADRAVVSGAATAVQRVSVDPKLSSDRWLRGLEYHPGDRRGVHAVSFFVQETGQWLGSWTPWHPYMSLPEGVAYRLAAGSHISAEIDSGGASGPVGERGSLGLYFASPQTTPRSVSDIMLHVNVAAGGAGGSRKLVAATTLEQDTNILALQPQILPGVQSIEVAARRPDGTAQILLFAKDIPLAWPTPYLFARPVALAKGVRLSVIEHYGGDAAVPAAGIPMTVSTCAGPALATQQAHASTVTAAAQRFKLTGTIKSVDTQSGRVLVQHGDIPGFMGAMTMFYGVDKPEELQKVTAGDRIQSDVVTGAAGPYLENIQVIGKAR
jgi:Cu/Ag efflux protein CusF/mono/diheme cytochrome c family protein